MAKQEKSAGAIIYYFDSEKDKPYFLLLKNTLKTTYWEFPKGKIEENENTEETARREAEEETGLKNLQVIEGFKQTIRWFYKFKGELIRKEAIFILIKVPEDDKNKVKIDSEKYSERPEHQEFVWLDFQEASEKLKIKNNREMLEKAYDFIADYERQKKLF